MSHTIYVWPDGVWCHDEELSQMTHKSDDYSKMELPIELSDQEIDAHVVGFHNSFNKIFGTHDDISFSR